MAKNNEEKKKESPTKWAESTKDGIAKGVRIYGDVRVSDEDTRDRKVFKNYSSTAGASSPASGIQARNQRNRLGIGLSRFNPLAGASSFEEYAKMRRQQEEAEGMRSAADKLGGMFKTAQEIADERKRKQDQLLYNMSGIGSKDRVAGLNAYKDIAKKQAIDKEQNDDLRYSMSGIGGSDRLAGMQAYQDISEQQRRKEMQEASEALMQNYGYKRIGDGNRAVMATPFSPLPKMKEENTVTAAQAPGVFGIKPETYLEQMGAVKRWESDDLKPTQETSDFLGKYFGGRIPTEDEFNQKYEEIYNDYSIPDEDVRYFFETGAELIGKEMERQSSVIEAGIAYDEATGLLGKGAGKYLSDNEAEYMSRYALKPYGETPEDARPMFSEMEGPLAMSQEALERVYQNPFAYKTQDEQFDLQRRGVMTEEELTIYDAIARNAGEDAAQMYLREMEDELNQRVIEKETADAEGFAGDHPLLASLIAPLDRLAGGTQFGMMKAEELLTGKTPSAYDLRTMPTREADTLVQGVGQGIEENVGGFWGKAAGFGYQTLMSLADMGANMLLYGPAGAAAAGGAMGVSAASSAYNDAIDRGADQQTANAMAAVSGIAEMLFEKFSIEKLIGIAEGKGLDKAVLNIMRQMGVEASEEMATEVANVVGDTLLMGDKSTVAQEGLGAVLANIGLAGLGGALMGGVSGGGAQIANSLAERNVEKELQTAAEEYAKQETGANAAQQPAEIPDELATGLEGEYAGVAEETAENAHEAAEAAQSEAEQAQPEAEQAEEEKPAETPEKAENKDRFKAKKAATLTIDGENSAVDVVGVDSVSDTGLIMLEVEDQNGKRSVANAADVSFADDASEELMGYAASERMDAKGLRSYMEGYDASIATPEQYAEAYSSVYSRGRAGVDYDNAALNNSEARQYMSNDAMIAAYAAGENAYNQTHDTVQPAAIETASGNAAAPANAKLSAKEGVKTTKTRGRVSRQYSQAAFSKLGKEGRRNAMSQMELLGALASRTGHTIRVVDSLAGKDGKKANAMYDPRTREITVALDATGGAYAYAAAHELTHALRNEHKSEWNGFRDFVRGALERNGQVWEDLVKYQQDRFGYNREDAEEEVICNTVPALLKDERNLFELYKGNRTLFDRVVNWVKGLLEDVKNAGQALSSRSKSWAQMDALANDRKAMQDIYDMMMRIMEGQSEEQIEENIINGVQESVMEAPVDASGNDVKYSLTTYTEELPKPIGVARAKKLGVDHTVRRLGGAGKRTVIASGRNVTEALMRYEGWSEAQISKVLTYTDKIAKWFEKAVGKYEYVNLQDVNDASIMIDHNTGEIVFSCQVPNAEYKVNFDFTTVCRQREAVQRFIDELSGEQGKNGTKLEDISLTAQNIWKLNEILKDEGYETACLGCFVEAKRYRIKAQADTLVQEWNDMVRAKNPNAEYFGFATGDTDLMKMSDEEIHKLEASMRGYNTKGTSKATQRAERLIELPEMQKLIRSSDIVSRQGRKKIREFSPALESFLVSRFGQGGAKPAVGFMPYNSEIAALPDTKSVGGKRMSLQQYLEMLGGAHSNSFSDYIPSHALDYIQRTLDMAARRTTAQCYTKVPARARTFGRTGEKINMSVMFDIDAALHWSMAGLNASGEYIVGDKAHAEQAFKETGVRAFTQSIPFDEAVAIEHDPAYAENCGIIGVGYAYKHIAKMMADNDIPYIIPYHRSSMPDAVARASNTKLATNYEDVQNTTRVTGYAVVTNLGEGEGTPSYAMWPEGKKKTRKSELTYDMQAALKRNGGDAKKTISEWLGWMADNNLTPNVSTAMAGHGDFDMYASLRKTKDPAKTANEYMAYCIEKGMTPVFFEFADQDGYDKTLFDFSVRNLVTGKTSLQGPVTFDWIDQMSAEDLMAMMDADMSEYNEYNREQFGSDKWNRVKEKGYVALQGDETEIRYSMQDIDDEYMAAVRKNDKAKMREMLDAAAKKHGFVGGYYHGTQAFGFTEFDLDKMDDGMSIFVTDDLQMAKTYSGDRGVRGIREKDNLGIGNYQLYVRPGETMHFDAQGMPWHQIPITGEHIYDFVQYTYIPWMGGEAWVNKLDGEFLEDVYEIEDAVLMANTREIAFRALEEGYDSVQIDNVYDSGGFFDEKEGDVERPANIRILFNPSDVKSADLITYDAKGNVIPLSERFRNDSNDIRYSLIDSDDNVRDAAKSAQSAFGMIRGHYITAAEADKLAGSLLKKSNSDYDRQRLAAEISRTMDYIERGEDVDIMQVFDELTSMGARVMEKSKTLDLDHEERMKPIRDYLKTTKIRLTDKQRAEAESAAGSYGAYRKGVFGRVRLVSTGGVPLDSAWQELSQMDPELFPADAREGDMPALLQAAVDMSKPVYHDGTGMTTEEGANWVALQLIDEYLKLPAVKAAAKDAKTFGESLTDLNKAVKRYKDTSWSEYQNALRAINEARDAKTKSEKQKELAAMRKKYTQWRDRDAAQRRERELKRRYRAKIEATVKQLTSWMAKPTDTKHVPVGMLDTLRRMLETLDFSGKNTKTANLLSERLNNLADVLQRVQEGAEENQSFFLERDQQMIDKIKRVAELIRGNTEYQGLEGRGIYDLNGLELKELSKWLDVIRHNVIEASKLRGSDLPYKSVEEAAKLSMVEIGRIKPLKYRKWFSEKWYEFFGPDMWDSFSFFERLGPTASTIFKGLRRGFDKMTQLTREAEVFTKKLLDGVDLSKTTGKKAEKITFKTAKGAVLELTRGNIMEIYVLSRREQATEHMYNNGRNFRGEGIVIADSKDAIPKKLTISDVARLTAMLSKDELRIADGLQRFLSKEAAAWGNATSRKLVGYNKFGEEFYWPINTDPNTRMTTKLEDNYAADINAIKNQGMTKQTVEGAKNAIVVGDIFDTYVRHISNMAAYAAYAIPLSDFTRWYNARGVKTQIDHIMGKKGLEYINNFLMAVNGSGLRIDQSGLSRLSAKLTRNAKIASVGANLRVVIQQPTSYARAALMISPKYLTAALTMKAPKKGLIDKYCGIAQWKHWGFYETNIGPSLRGVIVNDAGGMEKAREVATWLASKGDDWTLNHLWNACTLEAKDRGYVEGSEGFYTFVGDRMSEIIDRTQVVDSVFHRSQIMRSKNPLNQMLTNFMSEPNKTFNLLMIAIEEYASNRKNKAAKIKLARTLATYAVTGVMTAAAAAVIDAFRDEDDEKEWLEKYGSALLENAGDNLNPLGLLPGVKDVLSFIQGYSNSAGRMDTQSIQKIIWAADEIRKAINGESKMSVWGVGYKVSQALSSLFGLPVSNVIREVNAIAQTITGRTITKNAEGRRSQTAGLLYDAMMGESKRDAKKLRDELSGKAGMNPKEIDEQLAIRLAEEPEIAQAYEAKVTRDYATMNRIRNSFTASGFGSETFDRALEKYKSNYIKEKAGEIAEDDLVIEAYNAKKAGQDATVEQKTKALMDRGYTQEAISEAISMYGKTQKDMEAQLESTLFTTDEAAGAIRVLAGLEKGTVTESDLKLMISERVAASSAAEPEKSARDSIVSALKETYLDLDAKGDTEGMKRLAKVMKDQLGTEQTKLDGWVSDKRGEDLRAAVDAYDVSAAGKVVQKLRKEGSADSDIKARLKTYKEKYLEAVNRKDTVTANKIKRTLIGLGLMSKKGEPLYSEETFAEWLKTK